MEGEKNKGLVERDMGAIQGDARYRTSAAGRSSAKWHGIIRSRYFELLQGWLSDGHIELPSEVELLLFLEGEL